MLRKPLNNRGFSLLEVIVAMAIMGIGFVTILNLFSEGIRTLDYSEQYMKAVTLANNKMTELELMDFQVDTFSGVFNNEPNHRWELMLTPYESILNDPLENIFLLKVVLKVMWSDLSRERSVELVSIKADGTNYSAADSVIAGTNKGERLKIVPPASPQAPVAGAPAGAGQASSNAGASSQNISGAVTGGASQNISGAINAPAPTQQNVSGSGGGGGGISGAP